MAEVGDLEAIPGVKLVRVRQRADDRGFFREIFREEDLEGRFVQANHSRSRAGVLRGMHYHRRQADAWYLASGNAQVALADLRYRVARPQVEVFDLSDEDPAVLYVPPGVAHGFLALTDVELIYWVTAYYDASDEFAVAWDDPALGITWKLAEPVLSARDAEAPRLDWARVGSFLIRSGGGL